MCIRDRICAWIIPAQGIELSVDDVYNYCNGQIAHFKIPRYVHTVQEFPMTVTGKPQKFIMRAKMAEELGLEEATTA